MKLMKNKNTELANQLFNTEENKNKIIFKNENYIINLKNKLKEMQSE